MSAGELVGIITAVLGFAIAATGLAYKFLAAVKSELVAELGAISGQLQTILQTLAKLTNDVSWHDRRAEAIEARVAALERRLEGLGHHDRG